MGREGFNYDSDVARLERRWKRRSIANRYLKKKPSSNALKVTENNQAKATLELVVYENFMSTCTSEHGDYGNINVDEDCYEVTTDVGDPNQDPQYKMFLENVRQDGQSYAVVVFKENGVKELLRYEALGSEGDEFGLETPKAIESCRVNERIRGKRILSRLSNGGSAEIANGFADFSSEGDVWSPRTLRYHARNLRKRESMETSADGLSTRKRICLEARNAGRRSGIGLGLEGNHFKENGVKELLRYEAVDLKGDKCGSETPEAIESCQVNERIKGKRILSRLSNGGNAEIANGFADFSSEGDVWSPRTLRYHARNLRKRESMETSADGLSTRKRTCSAGRNAGRGFSIGSGLEVNHLIEYGTQEGDVDDVPGERRESCLVRKKADKEHRGPKSGGTSLRSGSQNKQFVENEVDCDNGDVDEEYDRFLNSINGGPGSEGNFWDQHVSDHEDDLDEEFDQILNSGSGGRSGGSSARLGWEIHVLDQHQSDHENEICECDGDEDDFTYVKPQTCGEGEIEDSDEFVNREYDQENSSDVDQEYVRFLNQQDREYDQENSSDVDQEYVRFLNQQEMDGEDTMQGINDSPERANCEYDQENSSDVDQEYVRFLNQQEMDGEDTMYRINDSPERCYMAEESESDVEIIMMDGDPYGGTPFVSSKQCIDVDNYSFTEDPSVNCSQFKKGLMEILKMPYDSKEHEALKEEVSCRRSKTQNRVMRNTTKSYSVGKFGKSYLDLHSDLAKQLDQAKNDDLKSFNLLRGFFYWLKHIADDKAFKPWLVPSCLEVLPQKLTGRTRSTFKSEYKQF